MGSYQPCSRRHCRHDLVLHRRAADGQRLLVGACQKDGCECSQYVAEGLKDDNKVLPIHGDHGQAVTLDVLAPGDPTFARYLPQYRERLVRDDFYRRLADGMRRQR